MSGIHCATEYIESTNLVDDIRQPSREPMINITVCIKPALMAEERPPIGFELALFFRTL
jgi:hypothetical protein